MVPVKTSGFKISEITLEKCSRLQAMESKPPVPTSAGVNAIWSIAYGKAHTHDFQAFKIKLKQEKNQVNSL